MEGAEGSLRLNCEMIIIDEEHLVKVLGMQNLAIRGTQDKLYDNDNGNVLKFVEYLALFDPLMTERVQKIGKIKLTCIT